MRAASRNWGSRFVVFEVMQQHPRASQKDGRRLPDTSGLPKPPQQQLPQKHHQQQEPHQVDASEKAPSFKAWHVLWWIVKGWWCSALWWVCFAFCMLLWCLAYAKADDGGEFTTPLDFLMYLTRVLLRADPSFNFVILALTPDFTMSRRLSLALRPCAS